MKKPTRRADVSAHRLSCFTLCPLKHSLAYQQEARRRSSAGPGLLRAWAFGKAFHNAIEDAGWARRRNPALPACPTEAEFMVYADDRAVRGMLTPDEHATLRRSVVEALPMLDLRDQLCDPETKWVSEFAPAIWAEGRYDHVGRYEGRVVSRDWKCGVGDPPTQEQAAQLPQVGMYLVDLHARWPEHAGWEVWLVHVRRQAVVRVAWSPELDRLWRGRVAASVRLWRRGYSVATPGDHCRDCEFRDSCHAWLELEGGHEDPAIDLGDAALLEERTLAKQRETLYGTRRKDCDKEIRRRMRGGRLLRAGGYEGALVTKEVDVVAAEALVELAATRGEDVAGLVGRTADISSRKVAKLMANEAERGLVARWTRQVKRTHVMVRRVGTGR